MRANGNGNGHAPSKPKLAPRTFRPVAKLIKAKGEPEGFRKARDILFLRYDTFKADGESLGTILKLAIECSKHAAMMELHANKQSGGDAQKYEEFQAYLRGDISLPPTPQVTHTGLIPERPAALETTGEPDGEDEE